MRTFKTHFTLIVFVLFGLGGQAVEPTQPAVEADMERHRS